MSTGKKIAIICLGVISCITVAIGGCGAILYLGFRQTDKTVSPKIDAILNAADSDTLVDFYEKETASELRNTITLEHFELANKNIRDRLGRLVSKDLNGYRVSNRNTGTYLDLTYNGKFELGAGTIRATFKWQDKQWKFVVFQVNSSVFK